MPFKSDRQRKFLYSKKPKVAKELAEDAGKIKRASKAVPKKKIQPLRRKFNKGKVNKVRSAF